MKKSELKKMIQEEYNKTLNESDDKWVVPFKIMWKHEGAGVWRVQAYTDNGKNLSVNALVSDSMPNDMGKLNKMLLGVITEIGKMNNRG